MMSSWIKSFIISAVAFLIVEGKLRFVDLSLKYDEKNTPYYGIYKSHFKFLQQVSEPYPKFQLGYNVFSTNEHVGTHIDAPLHFVKDGQTVDQIPLEKLVGPPYIIDVEAEVEKNRSMYITTQHIMDAEQKQGKIESGSILLIHTGFSKRVSNFTDYYGGNHSDPSTYDFPGMTGEAAQWIVDNREIASFGVDTPSFDHAKGADDWYPVHRVFLNKNISGFENMDLSKINEFRDKKGVLIIALPMKIAGGTGGPTRIVAMYDDSVTVSASFSYCYVAMVSIIVPVLVALVNMLY
ncbi:kynurenine formamidase-like [Clytia hemisphaerica]|uniref:Uncharacterized protein n=1 Tax=Clytia hemisphaerica TaxID=252671 RepID=A0A7M5X7V5_9CNID